MTVAIGLAALKTRDRIFYTGMALALMLTLFLGFSPSYFLRSGQMPPLSLLYHVHGLLFTAWMALFAVQAALVAGRRTDLHRQIGVAGGVLAAAVFVAGVAVSVETLRRDGGPPVGDPRFFFAIPMGDILVFGALVAAAFWLRHRSDWHKRLLLLATISLVTAAVARFLVRIDAGGPAGLFIGTDIFVALLVLYDGMSLGRVHPATLWGGAAVVVGKPLLFLLSGTPPWLALANLLRG